MDLEGLSPELKEKVLACKTTEELFELAKNEGMELTDDQLKEIGEIAKGLGFDITLEEAKAYLKSVEEELSDKALDAVAGGITDNGINCKSGGGYAA